VATQDGMIPPPAQRMMAERAGATVREEAGSHAIYVSKPQPVADIIEAGRRLNSQAPGLENPGA
jgi:hypothetical protein